MPRQIEVLAEDIGRDDQGHATELTGTKRILTYKAFLYLNANPEALRYKLLYEVDENGDEVAGSPNLNAQDRRALPQRSAVPVVEAGPSDREKELLAEIARLKAGNAMKAVLPDITVAEQASPKDWATAPEQKERKKPGPKPKEVVA